jgi:DNA-binding response OmpR family regulator
MTKVLLVDDEPDIVMMLKMSFEDEGHEVVTATNGNEALDRLAGGDIDVVVLDLMMPVADGWAVLEGKRARGDDTPVIVVSAKSEPKDMRRVLELGAVEYVMKPFDLDALLALATEVATRQRPSAETS